MFGWNQNPDSRYSCAHISVSTHTLQAALASSPGDYRTTHYFSSSVHTCTGVDQLLVCLLHHFPGCFSFIYYKFPPIICYSISGLLKFATNSLDLIYLKIWGPKKKESKWYQIPRFSFSTFNIIYQEHHSNIPLTFILYLLLLLNNISCINTSFINQLA